MKKNKIQSRTSQVQVKSLREHMPFAASGDFDVQKPTFSVLFSTAFLLLHLFDQPNNLS
jgi:hypothetical protein